MRNTKEKGVYEFLVYPRREKQGRGGYVGVCLTLDIVEEGSDPRVLMQSIIEAAEGHILSVVENKLDDSLLNRPAPKEYWDKYHQFQRFVSSKRLKNQSPVGVLAWQMTRPLTLAYA